MAEEFGSVAGDLLQHAPAKHVVVMAQEPAGEWFAKTLAGSPSVGKLFKDEGEVRAVSSRHALPFIGVHARKPDLPLLLEVLFVNTRFAGAI